MKTPKVSQAETAKTLFPQLAEENQQVQELLRGYGKSISGIEVSLRQIGLHVSAWHRFAGGQDDNIGYCWSRDIGYTHINDRWHIAVREWSQEVGREDEQTVYKFSEAPPWLCLEAAGKIAGLLRELIDRTRDMRANLTKKKHEVDELAAVLAELSDQIVKARA